MEWTMMRVAKFVVAAAIAAAALVAMAPAASAHPLGNFTSNTYAGLRIAPGQVHVTYVLDLAEIPTQQTMPSVDTDGDGAVSAAEAASYGGSECAALARGLALTAGGARVALTAGSHTLTFPPGLAGLSLLRLQCDLSSAPGAVRTGDAITLHDGNFADRIGWHEITAVGDRVTLHASDVPTASPSDELRHYPAGVPALQVRDAAFSFSDGGAAASDRTARATVTQASVPGGDRATRVFASLVSDHDLTFTFGVLAILLSLVLGAFHALAPGHGKTVMAAYIVGRRGTLRQALGIGVAVAVTHTAGVLALGLLLWTSEALAPERVYPVLGVASGLLVAAVGMALLVRLARAARRGDPVFGHVHGSGPGQHTHVWLDDLEAQVAIHDHAHHDHAHHGHDHHDHDHDHDHHEHDHQGSPAAGPYGWGGIVAMGFAGGLVPSPSAVIVLLGALALGRAWFGVTLVVAYGLGLAVALLAAGLLLVHAQRWLEPRLSRRAGMLRAAAWVPALTAAGVLLGGLLLAAKAAQVV
jgi:ABC-type nickel/cobalt efflux system permease component RcnA